MVRHHALQEVTLPTHVSPQGPSPALTRGGSVSVWGVSLNYM